MRITETTMNKVKEELLSGARLSHKDFRYMFNDYIKRLALFNIRDVYSCYNCPSISKVKVWNAWKRYIDTLLQEGYWTTPLNVYSYNTFLFSLEIAFGVPGSKEGYYIVITPSGIKHYTLTSEDQLYLDHKIIEPIWRGSFKDEFKGKSNKHYVTRGSVC